jgi:hypothetical protein
VSESESKICFAVGPAYKFGLTILSLEYSGTDSDLSDAHSGKGNLSGSLIQSTA